MAQSMSVVSRAAPIEHYASAAHNPFQKFGFDFLVERRAEQVFHKVFRRDAAGNETFALTQEVRYVVGSDRHGRAYLSSMDNYIFQTPINWFTQEKRWDLAPNVGEQHDNYFFRAIDPLCIYCHGGQAELVPESSNHYRTLPANPAIGCERCHGPGARHVQRRRQGDSVEEPDDTIVNPARLEPALRESVCQQCHLHGEMRVLRRGTQVYDFRPGLPLHLFSSIFVKPSEKNQDHEAVTHVEQMAASRCFRASNGKLGCISCHDPHAFPKPQEKKEVYRRACLKCHQETNCQTPMPERLARNGDDCTACHMPRTRTVNVAHTATSDHRIPRRPGQPFQVIGGPQHRLCEAPPLLYFHEPLLDPHDQEVSRDLAVGLMDMAEPMPSGPERFRLAQTAMPLLNAAVQHAADDLPAQHARGSALWILGNRKEAMACFETVLQESPQREATLALAAQLAGNLGRAAAARSYWEQAIAVNPYSVFYRVQLGWLRAGSNDWPRAFEEARAALRLNPMNVDARMLSIACSIQEGDRESARGHFEKVMLLNPPDAESLRRRFWEMMR
jgi:hypothetical protein